MGWSSFSVDIIELISLTASFLELSDLTQEEGVMKHVFLSGTSWGTNEVLEFGICCTCFSKVVIKLSQISEGSTVSVKSL